MAQQSPPLMDTAQLAARYATGADTEFTADQFDQFEFTPEGNLIYSMVGDEYAYEVAGVDTPNPTITIVSSPRSGTRRVPVAPGTGFHAKITEQLGAALQSKMAAEGGPPEEIGATGWPVGSVHEGIDIRRNQRLNEAPFKVAEHFVPADIDMPRAMPPTIPEAIATEEAALGERLGEIDEMQMSGMEGGMPQSYRSEQEVEAREQSGLDTLRQILRRAVRPAERKVRREARRGGE